MARKNLKFEINPLLSGPSLEARAKTGSPYRLLPLSEIDLDPDQPRRHVDPEALAELAASIKEYGVMAPILVRVTAGGTYRVVAGERRLRACRLLGLDTIPAVIDVDEAEEKNTLAKQLVENIQRQDLSPMERALAVGQLRDRQNWSIREIAKRLGTSKTYVQRSLDLLALPADLQEALAKGASETKVVLLARIPSVALRAELLAQLDEVSRTELEEKVESLLNGSEPEVSHGGTLETPRKVEKSLNPDDRRLIDEFQRLLASKVRLQRSKSTPGRGRLIIEFYSADDLNELHKRLSNQA